MKSFVFEQQVLFRFDFLYGSKRKGSVSQGVARVQSLEHLGISFFFFCGFICIKQQVLFNVDFLFVI